MNKSAGIAVAISFLLVFSAAALAGTEVTSSWGEISGFYEEATIDAMVQEILAEQDIFDPFVVERVTSSVAEADGANSKGGAGVDSMKYTYNLSPGDSFSDYNDLNDVCPADYDTFIFILNGPGTFTMEVEDCCILGDTMGATGRIAKQKVRGSATSPAIISIGPIQVAGRGFGILFVGYKDLPGGVPAGYYFRGALN